MASLQARHSRGCALGRPWTTFAAAADGCSCKPGPMYHVVVSLGRGGRVAVGRNRKEAARVLDKTRGELAVDSYRAVRVRRFDAWADEWLDGLRRPREQTKATYRATLGYAKEVFGPRKVRDLGPADVDRFLHYLDELGLSGSTKAKHLRHLNACLKAAVRKGYAARNPIDTLGGDERPKAERKEAAYFEDDELARLVAALAEGDRPLFRFALLTGMRQDELLSLTWRDVDLEHAEVRIGEAKTEDGRRRVDLLPEAVTLLRELRQAYGGAIPHAALLVFPGRGGKRSASHTTRTLYRAMAAARPESIPRLGPTGEARVFHSLRHTFARIVLENGAELSWLRRQLGHSSVAFTDARYGHWARKARKAQAARLEGAIGV